MNPHSRRRRLLDERLFSIPWSGKVLDIGGRKGIYRGTFRPPFERVETWEYVNINPDANPDYLASADALPLPDESIDTVLFSEVLEHLPYPERALNEAARVLKSGGHCYLMTPFLFPLHGDPGDYQRWLPDKYRLVLAEAGFHNIALEPMGGLFSVLYDLAMISTTYAAKDRESKWNRRLRKYLLPWLDKCCGSWDKKFPWFADRITTGYYVDAAKK